MPRLKVDTVKPGMILAEDLKHSNGRLLLAKGVTLEPSHLRVLKIWGIERVEIGNGVEPSAQEPTEEIDPLLLQKAEEITRTKFALANADHPFIREIFSLSTRRLAGQMARTTEETSPSEVIDDPGPEPPAQPLRTGRTSPESLIGTDIALASLPNISFEITKAISDPRSSAIHIADVISKDTGFSAKLLKIVNSAFYNFPSKIDTISRAVMIIGSRQLSALALGTSVIHVFRHIPSSLVDMKSFWEHSLSCGIAARILASYRNIGNTERLFVAGLLHDIGRLVLYKQLPLEARRVLLKTKEGTCHLRAAELELLGFDHTSIGGVLLRKWKLPLILEHAVEYHHDPIRSVHPVEASIIHVADLLVNALGFGTSGEQCVAPVVPEAWELLDLRTEILDRVVQLLERQVEEAIYNFFDES